VVMAVVDANPAPWRASRPVPYVVAHPMLPAGFVWSSWTTTHTPAHVVGVLVGAECAGTMKSLRRASAAVVPTARARLKGVDMGSFRAGHMSDPDQLRELMDYLTVEQSPKVVNYAVRYYSLIADTLHRDLPDMLPPSEVAYRERWCRDAVDTADAIQCLSEFVRGQVLRHFGADPERAFVTYCALAAPAMPGAKVAAAQRPYFLYPANDWPHKNHEGLLRAYALYRRDAGPAAWDLLLTGHHGRPFAPGLRQDRSAEESRLHPPRWRQPGTCGRGRGRSRGSSGWNWP